MLYEYKCKCGYETEVLQWSHTEVVTCIKCGKEMEKKFPKVNFVMKI